MNENKVEAQKPEFSPDRPVFKVDDDKFQRYNFSKGIAKNILTKKQNECLVLGIYGAWGEGKTSVLNFIENELKSDENIVLFKFNPWRYGDENGLLTQFFNQFAAALGDVKLKNKKETFGDLLNEYGSLVTVGVKGVNVGTIAKFFGGKMSNVSIETLKKRLDSAIIESGKKIVIMLDDIDRLDKAEIHSVFRLVKLNADFKNTTYILSFDEKMVAAAIGERFGPGDEFAGRNFLEKIIQVPLQIPQAQSSDLQDFCIERINLILDGYNIPLSKEDNDRFIISFLNNILFKITTPRLVVRYTNSLAFSIPILIGEVNVTDLLLIEAVKVFYPDHYKFVKDNPDYFVGGYESYDHKKDENKIKDLKQHLDKLSENFYKHEKTRVQELLVSLFPSLKSAFQNYSYSNDIYEIWAKNKRITSRSYFGKYFVYSALKGDISDTSFEDFLKNAREQDPDKISRNIKSILTSVKPNNFLQKLRMIEEDLEWVSSSKIAEAICYTSSEFPEEKNVMLITRLGSFRQAGYFVSQIIRRHENATEQMSLAKKLLSLDIDFKFLNEVYRNLITSSKNYESPFTEDQIRDFDQIMLDRILKDSAGSSMFEIFTDHASFYFGIWIKNDSEKATQYVRNILDADHTKVINVLKSFTPSIMSSSHPEPYLVDFTKEYYDRLISILDKNLINESLDKTYTFDELDHSKVRWVDHRAILTDIDIVRQFKHWFIQAEISGKEDKAIAVGE